MASIMASATLSASVRGKNTVAPEEKSIRGLHCLSRVADTMIEAGECLSDCHLNKQRLIKSLGAGVDENAGLMDRPQAAPPYKISRFHRESHKVRALKFPQRLRTARWRWDLARHWHNAISWSMHSVVSVSC